MAKKMSRKKWLYVWLGLVPNQWYLNASENIQLKVRWKHRSIGLLFNVCEAVKASHRAPKDFDIDV